MTESDLTTLSGLIAYERRQAGARAMRELYPDLPELHWSTLEEGGLVAGVGACDVANGTLELWVERLALTDARTDFDRPGYVRYRGTVDGIQVEIAGIVDMTTWEASQSAVEKALAS